MKIKNKFKGFTLIEIMTGILIVSGLLIASFDVVSKVSISKIKLIDVSNIEKETFFFSQRLYETIKKGGTIDYEEYFNRKVVGAASYGSGHYVLATGFGNFGRNGNPKPTGVGTNYGGNFYSCRSGNGAKLGTGGCVTTNNDSNGKNDIDIIDYTGNPQRYGEYSFQFIDYNSNADIDLGDEDGDLNIIGDDDDEFIGNGPAVFTGSTNVKELYLISADKKHRTFFRLNYTSDPDKPNGSTCTTSDSGQTYTGTGCIGRIEMLKLEGFDWGLDHDSATVDTDGTQYDGVYDTWLIDKEFAGKANYNAGNFIIAGNTLDTGFRLPLFSDNINVISFKIFPYPYKDVEEAWQDNSPETYISPYVRLKIILSPSRKIKKRIRGKIPMFEYSTTISLLDIYSR